METLNSLAFQLSNRSMCSPLGRRPRGLHILCPGQSINGSYGPVGALFRESHFPKRPFAMCFVLLSISVSKGILIVGEFSKRRFREIRIPETTQQLKQNRLHKSGRSEYPRPPCIVLNLIYRITGNESIALRLMIDFMSLFALQYRVLIWIQA